MPSKIKIGFYLFFPAGGIGRYSKELLKALHKDKELNIELICTSDFKWQKEAEVAVWPKLWRISHRIPLLQKFRFLVGQLVNPILAVQRAKAQKYDLLVFGQINYLTFPLWRFFLKNTKIKTGVYAHDIKRQQAILNRKWEDKQLQNLYRFADALFVHSQFQVEELIQFAKVEKKRIHIVPHGPYVYAPPIASKQVLRTEKDLPQKVLIALFFGQIRNEKNIEVFLKAMAESTETFHLVLAGQISSRNKSIKYYQQVCEGLKIAERVHFFSGHVPDEEVGNFFTLADWVALPYRQDFTSQSGVLNVAVHFERPVLVSNAPVLKETVDKSDIGCSCLRDDKASLTEGITDIQRKIKSQYVFSFSAYRQYFSWQENARISGDIYRLLLQEQ